MRTPLLAAAAATIAFAVPVPGATIDTIVLSADKDAAETQSTFEKDTARIYLSAHIADVTAGAKVTCTWIAVATNGAAPPNYKIDSTDLTVVDSATNKLSTSLSRPNAGWPAGSYEVDLSVDGAVVGRATFSVQ